MDEKVLRERLWELAEALTPRPQGPPRQLSQGAYVPNLSPPSGQTVEQLLDYVRLRAKYLMFDLEATRRENRYLREMLQRRSNRGEGTEGP